MTRPSAIVLATFAAALGCSTLAVAQDLPPGLGRSAGFSPPVKGGGEPRKPGLPPPPALPGAANQEPASPALHAPSDLQPTDALFDSIDRGDITSAKDALARGADLYAVNVLGMTPLEMSVDLGRNDITFLLLSLRGASSSARAGQVGPASGRAGVAGAAGGKSSVAALATNVTAVSTKGRVAAEPPPGTASRRVSYAGGDDRSSNPQEGFLGFGGTARP